MQEIGQFILMLLGAVYSIILFFKLMDKTIFKAIEKQFEALDASDQKKREKEQINEKKETHLQAKT